MKDLFVIVLFCLLTSCNEPVPVPDERDRLVGSYTFFPVYYLANMEPDVFRNYMQDLNHSFEFEKSAEPDNFSIVFYSISVPCKGLEKSSNGYTFHVDDFSAPFNGEVVNVSVPPWIDVDGVKQQGEINVKEKRIRLFLKSVTPSNTSILKIDAVKSD
jgi:hypothetical protein